MLSDKDKENLIQLLAERDALLKENERLKEQNTWLSEQAASRVTPLDQWRPSIEQQPEMYRGFKLDKERQYCFVVIQTKDGTDAPLDLQGRFGTYTIAKRNIDDYLLALLKHDKA